MKRLITLTLLITFYILLFLGVAEAGVRIARAAVPAQSMGWFWEVPNTTTGWALIPGSSGRSYNPLYEYDVEMEINSRALRMPESVGYEKPAGVYRVLVLGDSFIEASQVEWAESFPQQLTDLMAQQSDLRVEAINAGVGGWGNDQQLIWLQEEGYKYEPDLVLIATYPRNDFMNNSEALEGANQGKIRKPFLELVDGELRRKYYPFDPDAVPEVESEQAVVAAEQVEPGPLTGLGAWLHDHSALYRYIDPRLRVAAPQFASWLGRTGLIEPGMETRLVAQGGDYIPLAYQIYERELSPEWQEAVDLTEAIYARIREVATGMGAQTAAVVITAPEQVYPEEWSQILATYPDMQAMELDVNASHERAVVALDKAGVPVLDLLGPFRQLAHDDEPLHLADDGHWTAAGHELAARATVNFLGERNIVTALAGQSVALSPAVERVRVWEIFVWIVVALLLVSLLWSVFRHGVGTWLRGFSTRLATAGELLGFTIRRRQYVMLPLVVILLLFGGLLIIAQASVVGPFIYTLF